MPHHVPPLRIDIAILLILVTVTALLAVGARLRRQARKRPSQIRVNLVSGRADKSET